MADTPDLTDQELAAQAPETPDPEQDDLDERVQELTEQHINRLFDALSEIDEDAPVIIASLHRNGEYDLADQYEVWAEA